MTKDWKGIMTFTEQRFGRIEEVSLELLGGARKLAEKSEGDVSTLLIGRNVKNLARELIAYGADKVFIVEHPLLTYYQSDIYARIFADIIQKQKPNIVLVGATSIGMDLAPRVAAKLRTGLSAHVVKLEIGDGGLLRQVVPGFGGNVMAVVTCPEKRPQMATVRPGVLKKLKKDESRQGEIIELEVKVSKEELRARTLEMRVEPPPELPIEKAEIVVAGGWGICDKECFNMLKELAKLLGGAVGGTRPVLDEDLIKEDQMIGQSGKTIAPKVYIGFGISGEMHHVVGILDADTIMAVNIDPKAPIFNFVDYGVVGDAKEILPRLIKKLKEKLERK
nr:electron transfer flavoprotein subunit alpha/FixB family protein [Candidatus Baldrarchaeota archaeon]